MPQQRNMPAAPGIPLDAHDHLRAGLRPREVDRARAPLVPAAAVPHGDAARAVAPRARLAAER
jgi:hypothetical protein